MAIAVQATLDGGAVNLLHRRRGGRIRPIGGAGTDTRKLFDHLPPLLQTSPIPLLNSGDANGDNYSGIEPYRLNNNGESLTGDSNANLNRRWFGQRYHAWAVRAAYAYWRCGY